MQASGYGFSLYTVGAVGGLWVQFVSVCATHKKHNITEHKREQRARTLHGTLYALVRRLFQSFFQARVKPLPPWPLVSTMYQIQIRVAHNAP